jgi:integrase
MRPQEYLAVSGSAIDAKGVHVTRAIDGSGHALTVTKTSAGRRYIELSSQTISMVRHYAEHHATPNEFDLIFPASNGRWLCRKNWQRRGFEVACKEAGLVDIVENNGQRTESPKYRPYDLRHFFASMLIENKTNLKKIQTLMGHANIETTLNVYGHLLEEDVSGNNSAAGLLTSMLGESCGKSVANIY